MSSVVEKLVTLEREIAAARARGDLAAAKRLMSRLQQQQTLASEPPQDDDFIPTKRIFTQRSVNRPPVVATPQPAPQQSDADRGSFVVDFQFTPLGATPRLPPSKTAPQNTNVPPAITAISSPTADAPSSTAAGDKPRAIPRNPPEPTSLTAHSDLISWPMLQRVLPSEMAEYAKELCCGLGTKEYPGEGLELDSVWNLLHLILRFALDMRYSECLHLGIDTVSEIGNQLNDTLSGEPREYPCEQYDSLNEIMRGHDDAVLAQVSCSTAARCRLLRSVFLFRALVVSDVKVESLIPTLNGLAETAASAGDVVTFHNGRVNHEKIDKGHLRNASRFPHVLRELRNTANHKHPKWLERKRFPKDQFIKHFGVLLSEAMLEWISCEPWLLRVARGTLKRRTRHGAWFEIDLMGNPVVFVPIEHLHGATDDDSFLVDHEQCKVLFPHRHFWRTA
jgi:hypothetical protein